MDFCSSPLYDVDDYLSPEFPLSPLFPDAEPDPLPPFNEVVTIIPTTHGEFHDLVVKSRPSKIELSPSAFSLLRQDPRRSRSPLTGVKCIFE